MQSFPFHDNLCLLILSLYSVYFCITSWYAIGYLFPFSWLGITKATAGSLLSNYLVRSCKDCGAHISGSHMFWCLRSLFLIWHTKHCCTFSKCAGCLSELSEKPFLCHCHHSGCFQPEASHSLARAVELECLTRLGPGCSPVSQQLFQVSVATDATRMKSLVSNVGTDTVCPFLLVVTCSCVFL